MLIHDTYARRPTPCMYQTNQAKALLEKGCARSYGPACFNLAVMYKNGDEGVPK